MPTVSEFQDEMKNIDQWVAELRSLGVNSRKTNELNNKEELHDLVDNIKESMYQQYKTAYSQEE